MSTISTNTAAPIQATTVQQAAAGGPTAPLDLNAVLKESADLSAQVRQVTALVQGTAGAQAIGQRGQLHDNGHGHKHRDHGLHKGQHKHQPAQAAPVATAAPATTATKLADTQGGGATPVTQVGTASPVTQAPVAQQA